MENGSPGSVRGAPGNRCPYLDKRGALKVKLCEVGGESPPGLAAKLPGFRTKGLDGKV